jgi:triosephosphate isomerase
LTIKEARHLFGTVEKEVGNIKEAEIVICPPFVWLNGVLALARDKSSLPKGRTPNIQVKLGAQDCFWEQKGAFTGEISPSMLKNLGCQYVIVGHSERRKYFQETDEMINKKLKIALKNRLRPILCVGEEVRDTFDSQGKPLNEMSLTVGEQLEKDLNNIPAARLREIAIAYEPIWAIGTGNPCSSDDAMKASLFIRKTLAKLYNRSIAEKVRVLYGGSVTSHNAVDYIENVRMDGLLVGGASLNGSEFVKIIKKVSL